MGGGFVNTELAGALKRPSCVWVMYNLPRWWWRPFMTLLEYLWRPTRNRRLGAHLLPQEDGKRRTVRTLYMKTLNCTTSHKPMWARQNLRLFAIGRIPFLVWNALIRLHRIWMMAAGTSWRTLPDGWLLVNAAFCDVTLDYYRPLRCRPARNIPGGPNWRVIEETGTNWLPLCRRSRGQTRP